jgi:hypothetical protein
MRTSAIALTLALLAAPLAAAAEPPGPVSSVEVSIGAPLEAKASEYGRRDLDALARDLRRDVEQTLSRRGLLAPRGSRLHLIIVDAKPNRPTFAQLSRNPSLSMRSVSIGGATIDGELNGRPLLHFQWWEDDIRNERGAGTWTDAEHAFDIFAHRFANGRL